jgi:hypothetical protein
MLRFFFALGLSIGVAFAQEPSSAPTSAPTSLPASGDKAGDVESRDEGPPSAEVEKQVSHGETEAN